MIENVLQQMETWRAVDLDIPVSVNISANNSSKKTFGAAPCDAPAHPSVDPARLEIEVLKSSAMTDMSQVSQVIHNCGKLGVSFALDDFGTGYSSLAFLKRLPVDVLKIDQTFVRNMIDDPEDLNNREGMLGLGLRVSPPGSRRRSRRPWSRASSCCASVARLRRVTPSRAPCPPATCLNGLLRGLPIRSGQRGSPGHR